MGIIHNIVIMEVRKSDIIRKRRIKVCFAARYDPFPKANIPDTMPLLPPVDWTYIHPNTDGYYYYDPKRDANADGIYEQAYDPDFVNTQYIRTQWDAWDENAKIYDNKNSPNHNAAFAESEWGYNHIIDQGCCWTTMRQIENIKRIPRRPIPIKYSNEEEWYDPISDTHWGVPKFSEAAADEHAVVYSACCVGDIGHDRFFAPITRKNGWTNSWSEDMWKDPEKRDNDDDKKPGYWSEDKQRYDDVNDYWYQTEIYFPGFRGNFNYHNIRDVGCCNVYDGYYNKLEEGDEGYDEKHPQWETLYTEEGHSNECSRKEINTLIGFGVATLILGSIICYASYYFFCKRTVDKRDQFIARYAGSNHLPSSVFNPYKTRYSLLR